MIVQCEACQTRFRLADEKVKPEGTKVRCSKCKVVFTVTPPEPEPVEETIDFDSGNMEAVSEDAPVDTAPAEEPFQQAPPEPVEDQPATDQDAASESEESPAGDDLDFSTLEAEMGDNAGMGDELADDFSFVDTSQLSTDDDADEETSSETDFSIDEEPQEEQATEDQTDFGDAFEETDESSEPLDFDFNEDSGAEEESPEGDEIDFSSEESAEPSEFDFEETEEAPQGQEEPSEFAFDDSSEEAQEQDEPGEFSFGDDDNAFGVDDTKEEAPEPAAEETSEPGEFSFDEENPFGDEPASEWDEQSSDDNTSFDFEEPQFDNESKPEESPAPSSGADDLQFGEIDFASDGDSSSQEDDFSKASMELKDEPEPFSPSEQSAPPPSRDYDDEEPLPAPPPPKKSSLSRILLLLVLLLVLLGGAAGYLFMQEGNLNPNTVAQYLPFLQDYIGEAPVSSPGDRIGINISGSSYVDGQAGQMLVIQGAAVNNHPTTRSAITVKGVLLDAKGQTLLQQTVFCGNKLSDAALKSMSFAAIEEAMNNQFGDSLSNMNVGAGAVIPFTIVFRNLPAEIANINVEVVDSKPGAG